MADIALQAFPQAGGRPAETSAANDAVRCPDLSHEKINDMNDLELARAVAGGGTHSVRALEVLFVRHSDALLHFGRRLLQSEHEAEDLVHDVFVRVAETAGTFRGESSLRTWLFSLALNKVRSRRRRAALEPQKNEHAVRGRPENESDPAVKYEKRELLQKVDEAIGKLNDDERETFELYWFGKLSYAEISELTGITVSAAKVRVHRALARLSVLLEGVR